MSFYGLNFLFDNQYSENYGVYIQSIGGNGVSEVSGGANVSLLNDSVLRKPTKYSYGITYDDVLSFEMTVMSQKPIFGSTRTKVENWLFQKLNYKKLQIVQSDLQDIYFNCYLLEPQGIYIGNYCYGFTFTVECDSPWAWQNEKSFNYQNTTGMPTQKIRFYNDSDNNDFTYPYLEFQTGMNAGTVTITNELFPTEPTIFVNLPQNEIVKMDNNHHIISCSSIDYISGQFNKNFFKLLAGVNNISIVGDVTYLKLKYSNARKVGG